MDSNLSSHLVKPTRAPLRLEDEDLGEKRERQLEDLVQQAIEELPKTPGAAEELEEIWRKAYTPEEANYMIALLRHRLA